MLTEEKIREEYKKFDDFYEENEISPYSAALNYYREGARMAERECQVKEDTEISFVDNVGAYQTLTVGELVKVWKEKQADEIAEFKADRAATFNY